MGGVVDAVKNVVTVAAAPIYAPVLAAKNIASGDSIGAGIGKAFKPALGVIGHQTGDLMQGVMGNPGVPNLPSAPTPPSAADLAAQADSERRKAAVQLAQDRPGRAQTMLTDTSAYPYRMV